MTYLATGKAGRDKEMAAVMYNLKEQRVLEKSLQTLQLEQSYAIRLLDLDNRIIKVKFRKLKEKVSKIKSHLPADDISKFRQLDQEGKLKPKYSDVCLGSAIKIAAASRRLNLTSSRTPSRRGARSALPRISVQPERNELSSKSTVSIGQPAASSRIQRSYSVTGVFADVSPRSPQNQRPGSALVLESHSVPLKTVQQVKEDSDVHSLKEDTAPEVTKKVRTLTLQEAEKPETSGKNVVSFRSWSAVQHTHTPFSSHATAEKDARAVRDAREGLSTAPAQYNRGRRLSHGSNDSIDSNLGENIYEERRQELLEEENLRAKNLNLRTKLFLQNVDYYLQKTPTFVQTTPILENDVSSLETNITRDVFTPESRAKHKYHRRTNATGEFDDTPTYFPENGYKDRLMGLWKDMNKCRYLRLPDEKIDLSGINTLVKDQMKMFETLKQGDRLPLRAAWEN